MKNRKIILYILACIFILHAIFESGGVAKGYAQTPPSPKGTSSLQRFIEVYGYGVAAQHASIATVDAGLTVTAPSAKQAMQNTSSRLSAVLKALDALGITGSDRQTKDISVYPSPVRYRELVDKEHKPTITYDARNILSIRVKKIDELGALLDALTNAGANTIQSVYFDVTKTEREALETKARENAIADAYRRADEYATAAGLIRGNVISILESSDYDRSVSSVSLKASYASREVPIAEKTISTHSKVLVRFALLQ